MCHQLRHRNIVEFIGVCVCPPTLSLVFDFCSSDLRLLLERIVGDRKSTFVCYIWLCRLKFCE